jgi:hypothetical protein
MSVALAENGVLTDPQKLVSEWRDRIREAREDRRRFEPTWLSNLAFASQRHHLVWDRYSRTLVLPKEAEQRMARGELYQIDVITERRLRALGELSNAIDRPELLLVDDGAGMVEEDFQLQLNRAVGHGWDHEWRGDEALADKDRKLVDFGVAAIRCRFDPTVGPVKANDVPFKDGKPILDLEQARTHVAETAAAGGVADLRTIHEGAIRWEVLSPFNILVPPGIEHEKDFPWEIVVRPVLIDKLVEEYGDVAANLKEDTDIGSILGLDAQSEAEGRGADPQSGKKSRLRNHVWLYTCSERPSRKYPKGRVVVLASNQFVPLATRDELPVCAPDGTYRSGITYFHWWRVTGRFWSRSLIEPMKDIQRRINKRATQADQTIDRGQAYLMVDKNSNARYRKGFPVEVIELDPAERAPIPSAGIPPGDWLYKDKADAIEDLDRASGIGQSALGENPENATTYGQLALLHEQESGKRTVILTESRDGVVRLTEDAAHFIKTWWGPDKQILLDGDDDKVEAQAFNATKLADMFYIVRAAKGAAKPRSQAAEIQKIDALWQAALNSAVVQSDPAKWVAWYHDSLEAGQALDLPESPNDEHLERAELENSQLMDGANLEVFYADPPQIHIPSHRGSQIQALMAGDLAAVQAHEIHIQKHEQMAQQVAQKQAELEAPAVAAHAEAQAAQAAAAAPAEKPGGPPATLPAGA